MWQEPPTVAKTEAGEDDQEEDTEDEEEKAGPRLKGPQLRDEDGFCYFGPPEKIHELLNVERYVPVVPLAPLEELHGSWVQLPRFPAMRWLLHTRRVPVSPADPALGTAEQLSGDVIDAVGASEHVKPACAGIGDLQRPAWICHHCASYLCSPYPRMPPQALANWNWGGREHPK